MVLVKLGLRWSGRKVNLTSIHYKPQARSNPEFELEFEFIMSTLFRRSFIDPACCLFLHGFAHVSKVGFVHPIFSLWDINVTLGLLPSVARGHVIWRDSVSVWVHDRALKQSVRKFYGSVRLSVRCAVLRSPKKGETAVYGYDTALFLVLSVSCWCLAKLFFTTISFEEFSVSTK